MEANTKVGDETREMMEEICGPSAAAVESAAEDEALASAEVAEKFCEAAEDMIAAPVESRAVEVKCCDFSEVHKEALLREVELRHAAETLSKQMGMARDQAMDALDAAIKERDAAVAERDARIFDEELRAQRVDVEALRTKVVLMKKNLATVDARADERFVAELRAKDVACEKRLAELLEVERASVRETVAKATQDTATLVAVREGEAERVVSLNSALEAIWAFDKREPGCAYSSQNLVANLRQILSIGRKATQ
jgi:hypothetical protein